MELFEVALCLLVKLSARVWRDHAGTIPFPENKGRHRIYRTVCKTRHCLLSEMWELRIYIVFIANDDDSFEMTNLSSVAPLAWAIWVSWKE